MATLYSYNNGSYIIKKCNCVRRIIVSSYLLPIQTQKTSAHLSEVKLQRIVRAQAHIQSYLEEIREWVPLVRQKEGVIAQRAHRDPDLF